MNTAIGSTVLSNGSAAKVKLPSLEGKKGYLLDIGCGASKQEGFVGMDHQDLPGVDIVHSWNDFPWPLPDSSVLTAVASHVVEHVNPADGHFLRWMDEVWRVIKPGRQFALVTPYAGSPGYWQDPTHCNGCSEATFFYFDPVHASGFYRFYRPKPWRIEINTYHREGNLEVVLRKRPQILICGDRKGLQDESFLEPCPRPVGHPGDHWDFHQMVQGPSLSAQSVRVVVAHKGAVKAEWLVPTPLQIEDIAYRLADEGKS